MWNIDRHANDVQQNERELADWGFGPFFRQQLEDGADQSWSLARVVSWDGALGDVFTPSLLAAEVSGKIRRSRLGLPVTGDWVLGHAHGDKLIIDRVLERRTALVRRAAGETSHSQVIVANVDVLFIVTSANSDLNERRLERYLAAAWDSGARPVVLLNKVDLVSDPEAWLQRIRAVALGVDVVGVSARTGQGRDVLDRYVTAGTTSALIGSSGVGKSSLINDWIGAGVQTTGDIDAVERGRHTTTRRSLLRLPNGGFLIDTPGMREFGLAEVGGGLETAFGDVAELSTACRYADCRHEGEPGCALAAAIASGVLAAPRLESFLKLRREATALQARTDQRLAQELKRRYKVRSKAARAQYRHGFRSR